MSRDERVSTSSKVWRRSPDLRPSSARPARATTAASVSSNSPRYRSSMIDDMLKMTDWSYRPSPPRLRSPLEPSNERNYRLNISCLRAFGRRGLERYSGVVSKKVGSRDVPTKHRKFLRIPTNSCEFQIEVTDAQNFNSVLISLQGGGVEPQMDKHFQTRSFSQFFNSPKLGKSTPWLPYHDPTGELYRLILTQSLLVKQKRLAYKREKEPEI